MRHTFDFRTYTRPTENNIDVNASPSIGRNRVFSGDLPPMKLASVECFSADRKPTPIEACDSIDQDLEQEIWLSKAISKARFFGCSDLQWTELAETRLAESSKSEKSHRGANAASCIQENAIAVYRIGEGDPNQLIADALAQGASGILTEQMLPCPLPQCIVGNVDRALAEIAAYRHDRPDRKLLTVAVLGNSGKTSTCKIVSTITESFGLRTAYQSDLGCSDGVLAETNESRLPSGAALINWLSEASDCCSKIALIEIDEVDARDGKYDTIEFDVLVVTHRCQPADDFGPCSLQCLLERLTPTGIVIYPESDMRAAQILEGQEIHEVRYGTHAECEFAAIPVDQTGGMSTLMLTAGDTSVMTESPLCGLAMAANIAAATTFASLLGHSLHDVGQSLTRLRSIPGRGQRLVDFGRATVVLETGGTPERVSRALRTAKASGNGGRVWCVLAVGEQNNAELLAQYGQTIERFSDHCVVTSQPNQPGSFLKRSHQVLDGVKECASIRLVADQEKAVQWAIESSRARDTVVVFTNQNRVSSETESRSLESLKELVDSMREKIEVTPPTNVEPADGETISLKLFPG